jgi:uncharacterized protein (DUF952 family)
MIYHIASKETIAATGSGEYAPASFHSDGFIHCSSADQIEGVANAYYRDVEGLVLLCIDESRVKAVVRWEALDGAKEEYPHVYGPIPLAAIVKAFEMKKSEDGCYRIEKEKIL